MDTFAGGLAASQATTDEPRPRFFGLEADGRFLPEEPSRSPWNPKAVNGLAIGGLLMHLAEGVESPVPMLPAHVTIDILRPVPFAPIPTRAVVTREGKKLQMVESYLLAGDEPVARARVLRVREQASPSLAAPLAFPPPEQAPAEAFLQPDFPLARMLETRQVAGVRGEIGPGVIWARFRSDLAPGVPIEGVVAAAMLSDFGNGLARPVDREDWSFANVDISLHLVRRPVGDWFLIDADSQLQGLGVGLANMRLADRDGVFGRAHQTLFIDRLGAG